MSRPRVSVDGYTPEAPVRLELYGATFHLTTADAHALQEGLAGILLSLDPASEPPTRPDRPSPIGTPAVRGPIQTTCPTCGRAARYTARSAADVCADPFHVRRASGSLKAVHLPEPGHAERVAAALAGKDPER